jgi:hypothetical protein
MADAREYFADHEEALKAMQHGDQATIWTSFPGIIESFDPNKVTASVQPAIQAKRQSMDGTFTMVDIPVMQDVPVVFERGGGFILTFPVAKGDECIVWISSRCIDSWWQSGGVQPPAHPRMHDLSDGFCKVGPSSQAHLPGAVSTTSVQLRQVGGPALLDISAAGFAFTGNVTVKGSLTTTLDVVANGVSLENHLHSNAGGSGNSGPPVPGT